MELLYGMRGCILTAVEKKHESIKYYNMVGAAIIRF